jgi:hypothetical protein
MIKHEGDDIMVGPKKGAKGSELTEDILRGGTKEGYEKYDDRRSNTSSEHESGSEYQSLDESPKQQAPTTNIGRYFTGLFRPKASQAKGLKEGLLTEEEKNNLDNSSGAGTYTPPGAGK